MLFLAKPSADKIDQLLIQWENAKLNYSPVGMTSQPEQPGYFRNHAMQILGNGNNTFQQAKHALQHWQQFEMTWLQICWAYTPIELGKTVAVLARSLGIWSLTPCKIVYTIDEEHRYGFGYGTIQGHLFEGEERFLVEMDPKTGAVSYDLCSFSKPVTWTARLAIKYIRRVQRRFARDSVAAMQRDMEMCAEKEPG